MTGVNDVFVARGVRANRGDQASQAGIVDGLRRHPRVGQVFVTTWYPHHYAGWEDVIPVEPPPLRGLLTNATERPVLRRKLPVFWGGGVDLQDTGSKIKMPLILTRIRLLKRFGSPFVQAFQGAGPVRTGIGRFFMRRIVRRIDFTLAREPTAYGLLTGAGNMPTDRITQSVDGALMLECPRRAFGEAYLRERGLNTNASILGLNVRRWFHQKAGWLPTEVNRKGKEEELAGPMRQLVDHVAAALKRFADLGHRQFALIPMYRREPEPWEDDAFLLECVRDRLGDAATCVLVEEDVSPTDLLSIFTCLDLMIGVRLHSTIMAHVAGVPAVHIHYEHKGQEHYDHMNLPAHLIDIHDVTAPGGDARLTALLEHVWGERKPIAEKIAMEVARLRCLAESQLDTVLKRLLHPSGGVP